MPIQTQPAQSISTRFAPDTLKRLDEIAQNRQCSRSEVIKEAVEGYLNSMVWLENAVNQGLNDINAGHIVSNAEVKESVKRLGINVD
ncbi:CopG family ribbon-helix-helix protein [Desulfovibrio litoralis]|uniref:Predicted transcriptional regulator n=1 Tax=Desulfovibrio litoralis DSM 11393 TaxID=1121455 RepID=A0A1M7T108_9BACT|nr:ribbon-helix-helix protein, CopG family [Desulfovibrio litoralis]SHN64455.1 Predicted transcriptional regulator [Desulfovibrio litoralis DSM 11393]